jgi:hypothetical protein
VFPAFGFNSEIFGRRCAELVRDHGYDNELAYMKVLLNQLGAASNEELQKFGVSSISIKDCRECLRNFLAGKICLQPSIWLTPSPLSTIFLKILIDGSRLALYVRAIFGCEFTTDRGRIAFPKRVRLSEEHSFADVARADGGRNGESEGRTTQTSY